MKKIFTLLVAAICCTMVFGQIISVTDGTLDDWNNVPAEYLFETKHAEGASMDGLKSVKVYVDKTYINLLVEVNDQVVTDREWTPFHVFINSDNSAETGGYGDMWTTADVDIMFETAIFASGENNPYNPAVFKWWGEVGENGWLWTDPNEEGTSENGWGALIPEGSIPLGNSQMVDGKVEMQIAYIAVPMPFDANTFTIGFEIEQSWSAVGILPNAADTEDGREVLAEKLTINIHPVNENAADFPIKEIIDDITYELTTKEPYTATVIGASSKNITTAHIPASVVYEEHTYSVTSIGKKAFSGCSELTSITIPNSVTSIGERAFDGCFLTKENFINHSSLNAEENGYWGAVIVDQEVDGLVIVDNEVVSCRKNVNSVTIPEGVTSIGEGAFEGCSGLTSITIPESVTSIGYAAFEGCSGLTSITIPNSVTSIGYYAFAYCSSLTSVTIGNSVTSIGEGAFEGCSGLTSITIPESVTSIGYYAFAYCSSLTSVTIGNSVTSIGDEAFYECSRLTSITIPNSVTSIGGSAFGGCKSLTSVTIPNSVMSIGYSAFSGCSSLTSITIPNSVTSIGGFAFAGCGLTSVTIPNSVTSIGGSAFGGCKSLTSIVVKEGNTVYDSRENCNAIIETASNTLITGCKNTIIPNSVTSIGDQAFGDCSSLTSITIPNSVTSIGNWAFNGCSALTSITIPNSVTWIGDAAFWLCPGLTSITIPNSVTWIGDWAFFDCYGLKKVSFKGKTPPAMGENIFYYSNPTWVVPCGAYDVYASIEIAQQYGYAIEEYCIGGECGDFLTWTYDEDTHELAISGMHEMYDYVGSGPWGAYVNEITSITMEEGITYIGTDAFANCKYVQSLTIPASVEKIGNSAFENCRKLNEVNFAEDGALTEIGDWAFYNCHNLQDLIIPEGVTLLGDAAFFNCTYLKELTLPSTLMAVADNGFALCEKLEKMNVNAVVPPVVEARTFENVDRIIPVVVPTESVAAYKSAPVWQEFNIQGKDNVESDLENIGSDNGYGVMGNGKIMRNGQLIIIRDGVEYNTLGQAL